MPTPDIFKGGEASDEEIDVIFNEAFLRTRQSATDNSEYLAERRRFLGRIANIRHPDFGGPNPPEEEFTIIYEVGRDPDWQYNILVRELVYDQKGLLVTSEYL